MQEVTIADLFHLTYGSMLAPLGINALEDASKRPNVARFVKASEQYSMRRDVLTPSYRWWKDITSRPSWAAVKDGA